MTEVASLPACSRRHPGVTSEIGVSRCVRNNGTVFEQRYCSICRSAIAHERNEARARRGWNICQEQTRQRICAVPLLNWTPPEVLLGAPVVVDAARTDFQQLLARFQVRSHLHHTTEIHGESLT